MKYSIQIYSTKAVTIANYINVIENWMLYKGLDVAYTMEYAAPGYFIYTDDSDLAEMVTKTQENYGICYDFIDKSPV